jgi:hypothetical protein
MTIWNRDHPESNSGPGWHKRNPEASRVHRRKNTLKRLGVTPEQYNLMWELQQGACANPRCDFAASLVVDDFRYALHAKDDRDLLLGLIEYLEALN